MFSNGLAQSHDHTKTSFGLMSILLGLVGGVLTFAEDGAKFCPWRMAWLLPAPPHNHSDLFLGSEIFPCGPDHGDDLATFVQLDTQRYESV